MKIWLLSDDAGRVLAINENDMTGNSGWRGTTEEALGLSAVDELRDDRGAALYELHDGAAAPRSDADRQADWTEDTVSDASDLSARVASAESMIATHDVEIEQIVTGLEALANGG